MDYRASSFKAYTAKISINPQAVFTILPRWKCLIGKRFTPSVKALQRQLVYNYLCNTILRLLGSHSLRNTVSAETTLSFGVIQKLETLNGVHWLGIATIRGILFYLI